MCPNWCHNTLEVTGTDTEALERFVEQAKPSEEMIRASFAERMQPMAGDSYEEFAKAVRDNQPLSFASFVPEPAYEGVDVEFMPPSGLTQPDWYAWRSDNWGTKWDASFDGPAGAIVSEDADVEVSVDAQGAMVTKYAAFYKFDTAWSPPVPFVKKVSALFPMLAFKLRFAEVGNGFAGQGIYKAGETFEEIDLEVEDVLAPEEQWF